MRMMAFFTWEGEKEECVPKDHDVGRTQNKLR